MTLGETEAQAGEGGLRVRVSRGHHSALPPKYPPPPPTETLTYVSAGLTPWEGGAGSQGLVGVRTGVRGRGVLLPTSALLLLPQGGPNISLSMTPTLHPPGLRAPGALWSPRISARLPAPHPGDTSCAETESRSQISEDLKRQAWSEVSTHWAEPRDSPVCSCALGWGWGFPEDPG